MNAIVEDGVHVSNKFLLYELQRNEKYYRGISHALQTIARDEGIKGLYKGMGATLLVC